MTPFHGKSAFPEDHALPLGPGGGTFTGPGRHFLHKSDLVLGIGCSFTKHGITTPALPPGKKIIHATNDTRDLHKAFAADLGILGDAKLVVGQLIEAVRDRLGGKARSNGVAQEAASEREAWLGRWQGKLRSDERPINPYRVISEFMRVINPAEAIVTHDSGSPREQLNPSTGRPGRVDTSAGASRTSLAPGSDWRSAPRSPPPTSSASTSWAMQLLG